MGGEPTIIRRLILHLPLLTMSLSAGDFAVALTEKDSERLTLRNELNKLEVGEALQA